VPRAHVHELRVRYAECDAQGHVFNAHYLAYLDVALTELFRASFGSYAAMFELGVDLVVVEARLSFRSPARFDDVLALEIEVARLGTTSMTTGHRIRRDGDVLLEGELVHVFVALEGHAKAPIPDAMRHELEPGTPPAAAGH
jgi:acyl-CoA thioester hydrolase